MNKTDIKYLDFTSNAIVGCDMSLPCAERCWARRMARRLRAAGQLLDGAVWDQRPEGWR
jgi:protein gp37